MSDNFKHVAGIDLGTGNLCVAIVENGQPKVIVNADGDRTTPSILSLKNGERKIGNAAKRQMVMYPKNTVNFVKRFMGAEWTDEDVQKMIKMASYDVENSNGKPRIKLDDKLYTPEEISAHYLSHMAKVASDYYGSEVKDVVVTCPAWYNDIQRNAVKTAGELAGLNVLRVINEPTAAILSSNIDAKNGSKIIAVNDLGCGTEDVTVCEVSDIDGQKMIEVLASYGNVFLGGQNYDNAIVDWICDEFKKENDVDLRKDSMAYARVVEAAEKAKIELSTSTTTDIILPYITSKDNTPLMLNYTLTRARFEALTANLTDDVVKCVREAIRKSGKEVSEVDEILLVGGMTKSPLIQDALTKAFNRPLNKSVNPDEAVALGAAKQANIIVGGKNTDDFLLLDVTPISLGIETMGEVMTKLVEANTTIPTSKKQIFSTAVDNQPSVTIVVLQGERPMAKDNKEIGRFNLDGIAPAPRGIPQIEVSFSIDANGILSVSAKDKATGKEQHITIENPNSLSKEEIERIKAEAEKYKAEDEAKEKELKEFNELESFVYSVESALKNEDFGKEEITEEDRTKFKELIDKAKEVLVKRDLAALKASTEEIHKLWDPIVEKIYKKTNPQDAKSSNAFNNMSGDNPFSNMKGNPFSDMGTDNPFSNFTKNNNNPQDVEDVPFNEA